MSVIKDFYKGRTLLVTGGTGFMGKVLLEKLLRSLPEIEKIYVFLRAKKGLTPAERIKEIISKPPFTFNDLGEDRFKKLVAVQGDIAQKDLGLSEEDRAVLIDEVSVVFHVAASVRMNSSMKDAVIQNTMGTMRLLEMCKEMRNLVSMVHTSTTYCNVEIDCMEEKIYETKVDPLKIVELVQWLDEESLLRIQENVMKPHPNSYTFSKRLAEIIAWNCGKTLPVVICRPSIVMPSLKEPAPGWVDSLNGPVGIYIAAGKGIIRSMIFDRNCIPQLVPVDVAINSLIVSGYFRATSTFAETPIYNVTYSDMIGRNSTFFGDKFKELTLKYPFKRFLWYPVCQETPHVWLHNVIVLLFHMIPAYFIDFLLLVFMQKPFMVDIQNRLNAGFELLKYFILRRWNFPNAELMKLKAALTGHDSDDFFLIDEHIDVDVYMRNCFFGVRKFCVRESLDNLFFQRVAYRIMMCLEYLGRTALVWAVLWSTLYLFNLSHLVSLEYWKDTTPTGPQQS